MATRQLKTNEPGQPHSVVLHVRRDHAEQARQEPHRGQEDLRRSQQQGPRSAVRFRGGGHKRRYRIVDFRRNKAGIPAKVAIDRVRPQPVGSDRSSALRRWREALHPLAERPRRSVARWFRGRTAPINVGNALPLKAIPVGTQIDSQHRAQDRQGRSDGSRVPAVRRS